ncbi:hypothetical protein BY458DRAFT_517215 [Sporodiniella umbellata]|nr:hypothetical protein BY458DRAFT_517215 [Sporodiniella umbellata]
MYNSKITTFFLSCVTLSVCSTKFYILFSDTLESGYFVASWSIFSLSFRISLSILVLPAA